MSGLKVLHVVHNYAPEFCGGVERAVHGLAVAQRRSGSDAQVVCGTERVEVEARVEESTVDGVPVRHLVRGPGVRDQVDAFRADVVPLYEGVLAAAQPDVVHLHHWSNLGDDLVQRAVRRGAAAVITLYDFYTTCALFFRAPGGAAPCDLPQTEAGCAPCIGARFGMDEPEVRFRVGTRRASLAAELRAAAIVSVPSVSHRSAMSPHLPPGLTVRVVPLGADALVASAAAAAAPVAVDATGRTATRPLRVLHFGNLSRLKGVEFLVRAVRLADPDGSRIELRFAGPAIEADLQLDSVRQEGPYEPAKLRALAADADIAVFPSFARETYGIVVDEALRLGLPVLVSDRGALGERIGTRGRVLRAGDTDQWAAELRRLADDRQALAALRAGTSAPLATHDDVARHWDALYDEALRAPRPPVDVETSVLRRLMHVERGLGQLILRQLGGG